MSTPVHIEYRRSGGLAGIAMTASVDSAGSARPRGPTRRRSADQRPHRGGRPHPRHTRRIQLRGDPHRRHPHPHLPLAGSPPSRHRPATARSLDRASPAGTSSLTVNASHFADKHVVAHRVVALNADVGGPMHETECECHPDAALVPGLDHPTNLIAVKPIPHRLQNVSSGRAAEPSPPPIHGSTPTQDRGSPRSLRVPAHGLPHRRRRTRSTRHPMKPVPTKTRR